MMEEIICNKCKKKRKKIPIVPLLLFKFFRIQQQTLLKGQSGRNNNIKTIKKSSSSRK